MSIRVGAWGLDLGSILSMFGSKDQAFVERMTMELDADEKSVLERAVMEGVPFPELGKENWDHVLLMKKLFEDAPDQTWGNVEFKLFWLADVLEKGLFDQLDATSKKLIAYFVDGRPIFGKEFGDTEAFYGYLDAQEIQTLNQALDCFKLPPPDSPEWDDLPLEMLDAPYAEFTEALTELLPDVIAKKQGLAIYVG